MYTEDELKDFRRAGLLARQGLILGKKLIKKGADMLETQKQIEKFIIDNDATPAWPPQISCNHIAAHYSPDPNEEFTFDDELIKLDVGVSVNGCIGDNALTIDLSGKYTELVKASREALRNVEKILQIGTPLGEIGKTIQETIQSHGFTPVRNLGGHRIDIYEIHASPSIPNIDTKDKTPLEKGWVIASEPFATNGKGMVEEADRANLFAQVAEGGVRSPYAREVLKVIKPHNGLVFTTRWLTERMPLSKAMLGLKELAQRGLLHQYPPLVEVNKGMVSQAEHTFLIDDKVEVLTRDPDED